MRRAVLLCTVALAVALATPAARADESPIKSKSTFDERLGSLARDVAEKRVALAKKLEKAKLARDAWEELRLAIRVDPNSRQAREKLGYKKNGEQWEGGQLAPPPASTPLEKAEPKLFEERTKIKKDAAQKLAALAKRAKAGGLEAEARRTAVLAADEAPDDPAPRAVLGEEKGEGPGDWVDERERKLRAAFKAAIAKAEKGETKPGDEDIQKELDVGPLARRETKHAVILASGSAKANLEELAATAEATWSSFHYFFFGLPEGFQLDGDGSKVATGVELPELKKPRFLILGSKPEHEKFCNRLIKDATVRAVALNCGGAMTGYPTLIFESFFQPPQLNEWASSHMADVLVHTRLSKNPPQYMVEAATRFFSGHVSRRADNFTVAPGSTVGKREMPPGPFHTLRAAARAALADGVADELRSQLSKGANDLVRIDEALASSFFDYALTKERNALVTFLRTFDPKAPGGPQAQMEKAFGRPLEKIEEDYRSWVREEY